MQQKINQYDEVTKPYHYCYGKYELKDIYKDISTFDELFGHYRLTVIKYLWRCKNKNHLLQDLRKAQEYLGFLIDIVEEHENQN